MIGQIGEAIKTVRCSRGLKQEFMAFKLGYKDKSYYAKIERGQVETIDIFRLLEICKILDCNLVHLMLLAGIDIFHTRISSWSEFIASLNQLPDQDQQKLTDIAGEQTDDKEDDRPATSLP